LRDNSISVEFDPFGLSVKDLATRRTLPRSNSLGDLYPFHEDHDGKHHSALTISGNLWHRRLGHPINASLAHIPLDFLSTCNKDRPKFSFCDSCQLGKQSRFPFFISHARAVSPFDLIHCDLWTSPIISLSGYKYYLIILDDFFHYSWVFPLQNKSDTCSTLQNFFLCDNGGEFLTTDLRHYFSSHDIALRLSCLYTSPQNGRAERLIRTTNDIV
jgi:hypothetical protein